MPELSARQNIVVIADEPDRSLPAFLMAVNEAVRGVEVEDDDLALAWDGGDALLEDEVLNFPGISLCIL